MSPGLNTVRMSLKPPFMAARHHRAAGLVNRSMLGVPPGAPRLKLNDALGGGGAALMFLSNRCLALNMSLLNC